MQTTPGRSRTRQQEAVEEAREKVLAAQEAAEAAGIRPGDVQWACEIDLNG